MISMLILPTSYGLLKKGIMKLHINQQNLKSKLKKNLINAVNN